MCVRCRDQDRGVQTVEVMEDRKEEKGGGGERQTVMATVELTGRGDWTKQDLCMPTGTELKTVCPALRGAEGKQGPVPCGQDRA